MIDDRTWLNAVRRVGYPGSPRAGFRVDRSVAYNRATGEVRRNPSGVGQLEQAPPGALYSIGVRAPDGYRYALDDRDEQFVERLRLGPGDSVSISWYDGDQFAQIDRNATLELNGRCTGCWRNECVCESRENPLASNPQLQVLGDYTRTNPGVIEAPAPMDSRMIGAIRKFHGKVTGEVVSEYRSDDGKDEVVDLAYLGHVPAVSWLGDGRGASTKQIDVNGELVSFSGFRKLFRGQSRPVLALYTPTNEAVVVQGTVASLTDRCDSGGVLGFSPVVEYIVEAVKGSSKGSYHYVHEFERDYEPVLRWCQAVNGLIYDKDRTLIGPTRAARKAANPHFNKTAIYEVSDWFHEKGVRRHGEGR